MPATDIVQTELLIRREKLETALTAAPESSQLSRLLSDVDAALARLGSGTYGRCDVCHDAIEPERLAADPLTRHCLDHLSPEERRVVEQDLDLASRIQNVLLPPVHVAWNGWETSFRYEPLRTASGDYCDLITTDEGDLVFLLGDVSGKGIGASMLMAHLHALFRSLVSLHLPFPELVQRANRIFCESTNGLHYATVICGRAARDGRVEIGNAGHCPPLVLRRGGEVETLAATSLPIGLFCSVPTGVSHVALHPGDTLLMYTDGVTEARNTAGDEYGVERLTELVHAARGETAQDLVAACIRDIAGFRGAAPREDDVTILALRRTVS